MQFNQTIIGDTLTVLKTLPDEFVDCVVTSPPYWGLRDYGVEGQIGLEKTPEKYVEKMVDVFRELKRVLKKEGTCWLNLGDSYAGSLKGKGCSNFTEKQSSNAGSFTEPMPIPSGLKPKDLVGIPWRVAFALQADGWYLRQDIIWAKPNPMPESVTDRCTKSHEYVFLLTKSARYYFDNEAIRENNQDSYNGKRGTTLTRKKMQSAMRDFSNREKMDEYSTTGRNKRDVWSIEEERDFVRTVAEELDCYGIDKEIIETCLFNAFFTNRRSVWTVTTTPYSEAHFATFPEKLIEPMIKAGSPVGGLVLDPFMGSGTTGRVAIKLNRNWLGIELNLDYGKLIEKRTDKVQRNLLCS